MTKEDDRFVSQKKKKKTTGLYRFMKAIVSRFLWPGRGPEERLRSEVSRPPFLAESIGFCFKDWSYHTGWDYWIPNRFRLINTNNLSGGILFGDSPSPIDSPRDTVTVSQGWIFSIPWRIRWSSHYWWWSTQSYPCWLPFTHQRISSFISRTTLALS